ncbi:hypothetical protein [Sciscionella marina]|uniref:hypothetical protein n=1 Tax=Sciscionella marina TaxID=508770 RepID=UPI00036A4472|nr:hypothetical protein [Sciscionella marina]
MSPRIECAEADGVGVDGRTRPSEDRIAVLEDAVILLDGATNLVPGRRSGGWYAEQLCTELSARLRAEPDAGLVTVLETGIAEVARRFGLVPGDSPSATVAMLRVGDERVDALVLADSPIVLRTTAGIELLADERLRELPRSGGGYRKRLAEGGGFGEGHLAALRAGAEATGRLRNVDGGFWVAEADPRAARRAMTGSWPRERVRSALLASDGVSCAVDDYEILDWAGVFRLLAEQGPGAVIEAVHTAELADPDGARWPRPKVSDDKALAYLDLEQS